MKRWRMLIGLMLVALTACGGGSAATDSSQTASGGAASEASFDAAAAASPDAAEGSATAASAPMVEAAQRSAQQQPLDRLVIRTATQQLVVENVDEAEAHVRQIAADRGGYVLSSSASGEAEARNATITIKVPSTSFDETLTALAGLAQKVESQQVEGKDVTDEYVDLQSRLRNLRALEARLLQFLEEARTVEDSLRVSSELAETQGQIEQAQGRINYLEKSAQFATITTSLRNIPVTAIGPQAEWSPVRIAREALQSMLVFGQGLLSIVIVVAIWLPVWGPLLLASRWLWRRMHRLPVTTL